MPKVRGGMFGSRLRPMAAAGRRAGGPRATLGFATGSRWDSEEGALPHWTVYAPTFLAYALTLVQEPETKPTKRRSRRKFLAGMFGAGVGGYAYMRWVEPHWLTVGRHEVQLGNPASSTPIRLLQLSDFHASEDVSLDFIGGAVRKGVGLKPDLICLTGDFITWRYEAFARYAEM